MCTIHTLDKCDCTIFKAFRKAIFLGGNKMHIIKCSNGLYKIESKLFNFPLYVENYNQALEIVFKLVGVKDAE